MENKHLSYASGTLATYGIWKALQGQSIQHFEKLVHKNGYIQMQYLNIGVHQIQMPALCMRNESITSKAYFYYYKFEEFFLPRRVSSSIEFICFKNIKSEHDVLFLKIKSHVEKMRLSAYNKAKYAALLSLSIFFINYILNYNRKNSQTK